MQGPYNLRPIVSKIKKDIGAIKPELKFKLDPAAASSVKKVTAEIKKLDAATKGAQKSVGSLNSQLLSLASSFNSAATASKTAANAAANVGKATAAAAKSATQARTAIEEFGKQSGLAIKRFAAFSSVTTIIFGVTNAITDAYKEFLIFNKEIVRLSQVTDKSVSDLKGISNEITRLSTTIGVASSDLITVASTLAQAGLSAQDTKIALEALAKSALAPSFENIIDTTEGAIAAIRQFGLETSQLEGALGSINAVAAAFAVEASDIIAAIQRTGGVFASASRGVSEGTDALNEFVAIFTSIRQTTRESAETIATGLRTIFTRIQRSSTIELLKQYGVELRDLEGKFVGPYEAVRRLSEGLSRIDPRSADFARISEELGGFRQIGKVIPLIQQFAVAQDALNVAQRGSGSLSRDVQTAQQSLAVQFAKTRENFLALVREIGDSQSFKVVVSSTLFLTNALVDLGRALKPLLPLLLTFGAIKLGGGLNQFASGFGLAFNRGGGPGGTSGGGGGGGTGGGPGGGNQPLTSALSTNTTATNVLNQTIVALNTSVLALNQNIVNTNSLLMNRPTRGFATGGLVPGSGNRDTVRANLTPGEFVIRKSAVQAIGSENLAAMNTGGMVQKFKNGTKGRGVKGARGSRSKFKELSPEEMDKLSTQELIAYGKALAYDIFSTGGAGMAVANDFIEVAPSRIVPELEPYLQTYLGKRGFWRERVAPFGQPTKAQSSRISAATRESALAKQVSKQADEVAARSQQWSSISSGSAIDSYLLSALKNPVLADYQKVRGGDSLDVPYHNTRLRQSVNKALDQYDDFDYSAGNIDKLVSGMAAKRFASGGFVRQYAKAKDQTKGVKPLSLSEQLIAKVAALKGPSSASILAFSSMSDIDKRAYGVEYPAQIKSLLDSRTISKATGTRLKNIQDLVSKAEQAQAAKIAIAQNKQNLIQNNIESGNFLEFGAAGLRYGSNDFPKVKTAITPETQQTVKVYSGALNKRQGKKLERQLFKDFRNSIINISTSLAGSIKATPDLSKVDFAISNAGFYNVIGAALESAIGTTIGQPYVAKTEESKSIDFIGGLGSASKLFDIPSGIPTDVTRTLGGYGKSFGSMIGQIDRYLKNYKKLPIKKAAGGGISGEDTVPALLTPGEFVFNKDSAQRIGYGTLNRLNKVKGYNKGGIVSGSGAQAFAEGGPVNSVMIGAALSSVLLPQVQKLADTFIKLEGTAGEFGVVLGGAIREASSTILSASIALEAVGASRTTRNLAIGAGGLVSGVSGAMSDSSAKALEKALLSNTSAINKFETNLQDIANAPTEELRAEAAARLEKSFTALDISVRNSKDNIDRLENLKNFSDSMQNINMVVLTTVTAMTALAGAANKASLAMAASRAPGAFVTGAAAVSTSTRFLASISGAIPYIGAIVGLIGVGVELFGLWNTKLKSSNEQFDRLNKALDETVKNSQAYNLGNKNFVENILPKFQDIVNKAAAGRNAAERQDIIRTELSRLPSTSPLDLRFRQRLIPRVSQQLGIGIGPSETVADIEQKIIGTQYETAFRKIIKELEKDATIADATSQLIEKEGLDRAQAEKKINELIKTDQNELNRLAKTYSSAKLQEILSARLLADASNRAQVSLVKLDNILTRTSALYEKSLTNLSNSFQDLDTRASLLLGEANLDLSRGPARDIQTLQNLIGSSRQEVVDVMSRFTKESNLPTNFGQQLTDQVMASQMLEQRMGILLNQLASEGGAENLDQILQDTLGKGLASVLGTDTEAQNTISTILQEVKGNLEKTLGTSNAPKNLKELASSSSILNSLFESGQKNIKFVTDSLEVYNKGLKELTAQQKNIIELENQIRQKTLQRIETEKKASIQFREIFNIEIPLADRLDVFNAQIRQQTGGVAGLPVGGTTNVADINAARQRLSARITELEQQSQINRLKGEEAEELRKNKSELESLNDVISKMADGGEQVNLVFEAIAKQRDQFKTQREVLIDILKRSRDPAQQLQLRAEFESIQAVMSGRFSEAQAFRALDTNLLNVFSDAQQENIKQIIIEGLRQGARPSTPQETKSIFNIGQWLVRGGFTKELQTALGSTTRNIRAAGDIKQDELIKLRDERIKTSIKLFDEFNASLRAAPGIVVEFVKGVEGDLQKPGQAKASVISAADTNRQIQIINKLASLGVTVGKIIPGTGVGSGTEKELLFNKEEIQAINMRTASAKNFKEVGIILQEAIAQKGRNLPPGLQVLNEPLNALMLEISEMMRQSKRDQQPSQPAPNPRTQTVPSASLDPRNLDRFSTSATQLATALTGDNTSITQLTAAVGGLKPATDNLINAVAELKTLFKDGKIQVSQETKGEVSVNFNNSLPIERDANADTRFLDQVSQIAQDTISQQLNSFLRRLS